MGQSRRFGDVRRMSGLPPTADISGHGRHFVSVPGPDISVRFGFIEKVQSFSAISRLRTKAWL
jgi:hypothetical protein